MLVPVGCGQTLAETDMLSAEQYEEKLIEISRLDDLGEMQVKVTCGPHYERVVRQEGLYAKRKKMNIDDGTSIKKEHGKSGKGWTGFTIWQIDSTGNNPAIIETGLNTIHQMSWSPDGSRSSLARKSRSAPTATACTASSRPTRRKSSNPVAGA